jgi:hypothetical protein
MTKTPAETYAQYIYDGTPFDARSIPLPVLMEALDHANEFRNIQPSGTWKDENAEKQVDKIVLTAIHRIQETLADITPKTREYYSDIIANYAIIIQDDAAQLQIREQGFGIMTPSGRMATLEDIWGQIRDDADQYNHGERPEIPFEIFQAQEVPSLLQRVLPHKPDGSAWVKADLLEKEVEIHYVPPKSGERNVFDGFRCYIKPASIHTPSWPDVTP